MDRTPTAEDPALSVEHLSRTTKFEDVSFTVRPGEIMASVRPDRLRAGDVIRALYGIAGADSGDVRVNGQRCPWGTGGRRGQGIRCCRPTARSRASLPARASRSTSPAPTWPLLSRFGVWMDRPGSGRRRRLHPPHLDQGPGRRHHRQQPLRRQPAEGRPGPPARRAAADPAPGGADPGRRHRRQGRDPPDHRRAGRRRHGGAGGLHRPRRGAAPRRPGPGHALRRGLAEFGRGARQAELLAAAAVRRHRRPAPADEH